MDDDTPSELLLRELLANPAWKQVQARLLERRDQMVASLSAGETFQPKTARGNNGAVTMASEEAGVILARIADRLGFIRALNEMAATPQMLLDKAAPKEKAKA